MQSSLFFLLLLLVALFLNVESTATQHGRQLRHYQTSDDDTPPQQPHPSLKHRRASQESWKHVGDLAKRVAIVGCQAASKAGVKDAITGVVISAELKGATRAAAAGANFAAVIRDNMKSSPSKIEAVRKSLVDPAAAEFLMQGALVGADLKLMGIPSHCVNIVEAIKNDPECQRLWKEVRTSENTVEAIENDPECQYLWKEIPKK